MEIDNYYNDTKLYIIIIYSSCIVCSHITPLLSSCNNEQLY